MHLSQVPYLVLNVLKSCLDYVGGQTRVQRLVLLVAVQTGLVLSLQVKLMQEHRQGVVLAHLLGRHLRIQSLEQQQERQIVEGLKPYFTLRDPEVGHQGGCLSHRVLRHLKKDR